MPACAIDQKSIITMSSEPVNQSTFFTGSYDGRIHAYDVAKEACEPIQGSGPTNSVVAIDTSEDGKAYIAGMDDTIREMSSKSGEHAFT